MRTCLAILFSLLLLIVFTKPVYADIAPPSQPPGSNLYPENEETQVRMVSETVLIDVLGNMPADSLGIARVSASFTMRNLGTKTESFGVLFPASANDGFYNYPEIEDFQAMVNGRHVTTRPYADPLMDEEMTWVTFDAEFPPGEDVLIEVSYTLDGTGEYPFVSFAYLLETGAGWKGTIGSADLIVRLPYEANHQNVFIDSSPGWGHTSPNATLSGNEISWHFDDLEPTSGNNLAIALVMTSAWEKVLTERANVDKNPQDGEAWGRLGKVYKEISRLRRNTRDDAGGQELFQMSVEAYQQAVTLLPDDALWHAGYAELLFDHHYWKAFMKESATGVVAALEELDLAYQLGPKEPFIIDLMEEVHYALPEALGEENGQYTFTWLTVTPTTQPSSTPEIEEPTSTATIAPSATLSPMPSASNTPVEVEQAPQEEEEPTPTPSRESPIQLCPAFLIPFALVLLVRKKKV